MSIPTPVRRVQEAAEAAAVAVAAQDREALDAATDLLARTDPELQRGLLAGAVRVALERSHPAGLDSESARDLLERCVRSGLAWLPDVQVPALVIAVTGALGMQDPDEEPELPAAQIAVHAVLLLAELDAGPAQVAHDLAVAVAELTRAETVELP